MARPGMETVIAPSEILTTILACPDVFVKKLSVNDRDWARFPAHKHQNGFYVPVRERDSGFFPRLVRKTTERGAEVREALFDIDWLEFGQTQAARLVNYTSKGEETHLTGVPKLAFKDISPASFAIIGKRSDGHYVAATIDSESDDYEYLSGFLSLPAAFVSDRFDIDALRRSAELTTEEFVDAVLRAYREGSLRAFAEEYATIPKTPALAREARDKFMSATGIRDLSPFKLDKPGDVIRHISRDVEYEIFRRYQFRQKVVQLLTTVVGEGTSAASSADTVLNAMLLRYEGIDKLMLSAAQQRKSRAGYSFEHHIHHMLKDGGIPFEEQVVIRMKRRPDFVLPNKNVYEDNARPWEAALVLSAKTTLRERWKQVQGEVHNCALFLATLDENIASNAIIDMADNEICLVVPESLKKSEMTEYKAHENVIDFKTFFEEEVRASRMPLWVGA